MPTRRSWLTFLLILLVNYALVRMLFPRADGAVTVPYTLFKQEVTKRNVEKIYSRGESIRGRFRAPITYPAAADTANRGDTTARVQPRSVRTFATTLPSFVDEGFETLLISNGVEISAEPIDEGASPWLTRNSSAPRTSGRATTSWAASRTRKRRCTWRTRR